MGHVPTRRGKTKPSPSSGTPVAASPLLLSNRYVPDVEQLTRDLASALLHVSSESPLADVTLQTADGVNLPVNKTLLAIRSPYFRNLFYSRFAEAGATHVSVPLCADPLRHVFQFVYTADCQLIHEALSCLPSPPTTPGLPSSINRTSVQPVPRQTLVNVVDLAVAADYFHITQLQRLANDTLSALVTAYPPATCTALEAMRTHPMALKFCDPLRLWADTMRRPRHYFLVPDCNLTSPAFVPDELRTSHYGVLELSGDTLDYILRFATHSSDFEYLFQVIYYWATNGSRLELTTVKKEPSPLKMLTEDGDGVSLSNAGISMTTKASDVASHGLFFGSGPSSPFGAACNHTSDVDNVVPLGIPIAAFGNSVFTPSASSNASPASTSVATPTTTPSALGGATLATPPAPASIGLAIGSSLGTVESGAQRCASGSRPRMGVRFNEDSEESEADSAESVGDEGCSGGDTTVTNGDKEEEGGDGVRGTADVGVKVETDGGNSSERLNEVVPKDVCHEQWERGVELCGHINWSLVTPEFIRDYVEGSGLVKQSALFQAYKFHATKDCVSKTGSADRGRGGKMPQSGPRRLIRARYADNER